MDAKLRFAQVLVAMLCVVVIAERAMGDDDDGKLKIELFETMPDTHFKKTAEAEAHEKRIATELAALDLAELPANHWAKEFAGVYYSSIGLGDNVAFAIAPNAGISYQIHGCTGIYAADHGDIVKATPEGITVKWRVNRDKERWSFLSSELYFVRWGPRRYLVAESQMQELATEYNKGGFVRDHLSSIPLHFTSVADYYAAL
jgi:hypothetical protein